MKFLILCLGCFSFYAMSQTSVKDLSPTMGSYSVGFKHYQTKDPSRTYQPQMDFSNAILDYRPMEISLWYPAEIGSNGTTPLSVLHYMEVLKQEEEWEHLPNAFILNWFYYRNTPINQAHLQETTQAYSNVPPAKGQFPVVIYAPSFHASSAENFTLCEYLASHGYVVISAPSRGSKSRWMEGGQLKDIETQARDLEFLIKEVKELSYANTERMATIGYSFGGLSHILTAMRYPHFKAIISLDGAIKYQYEKLKASPFHSVKAIDIPFIHMAQKTIPQRVLEEDHIDPKLDIEFNFYDQLEYSEAYTLKFHDLSHAYFSSMGVLFQNRDLRQDKSDQEIMRSYKLVCNYSLRFLEAYLKDSKTDIRWLQQPSSSTELLSKSFKAAKTKPYTHKDFNETAAQNDYRNLEILFQKLRAKHQELELPQGYLNTKGLQLTFHPNHSEAGIRLLEFGVHLYPKSANLYDSLAEAYLYVGNTNKAILNFKRSLTLDPSNSNATMRLKELLD